MPWQKTYDRSRVLERAMRAFWARGYDATSMADLVSATGINRGSIYAAFDSKRGLFIEALRHYDRTHRENHLSEIEARVSGADAIIAAFEAAARMPPATDTPGGCLLVNTALELSPHDAEVKAFVAEALAGVEAFFLRHIERAIGNGVSGRNLDPRAGAQALLGLFLGLRVLMRAQPGGDAAQAIVGQVRKMLQ